MHPKTLVQNLWNLNRWVFPTLHVKKSAWLVASLRAFQEFVWQPYVPLLSNFDNKGASATSGAGLWALNETSCLYYKLSQEGWYEMEWLQASAMVIFLETPFHSDWNSPRTQVLHQRAILVWNEDILSLPRGRDLNQRRAFGNWQARAAECCRTSVRLLDLRTFQVWALVYRTNKWIFKSNLLEIQTAKCSLSSFCLFALCLKKQTLVAFSSWSNDIESPKPLCHLGFCSTSSCLFHQVVDNGLRPCWTWDFWRGLEG